MPYLVARGVGRVHELAVLACMLTRYFLVVLPFARAQLREWERIAEEIPDPVLRRHALGTLQDESFSAFGAALVALATRRHDPALVQLLMALQIAWDYIDTLAEQPAPDPVANGVQLHRALADALGAAPPRDDYYRLHPQRDDGGYLRALVEGCRAAGARLPAYAHVLPAASEEIANAEVQYLNHAPPGERATALRQWAAEGERVAGDAAWLELAAAASSSLGVLAILALAADPATDAHAVAELRAAYVPWVDALTALLDSLVDGPADEATGMLNWVAHYPSRAYAGARLAEITARAIASVRALPRGERHVVLVAGMVAMHLSQPSAHLPGVQPAAQATLRATGTAVTPLLLTLLRCWRLARRARRAAGQLARPTGQLTPVPPSPQ